MMGLPQNIGTLLSYLFEAALFLIYAAPFQKARRKRTLYAQYALFCVCYAACKVAWAKNDLYNIAIMVVICSLYFFFCCALPVGSLIAHSCIFASIIDLCRAIVYGMLRLLFGDALFAAHPVLLRLAISAIKGVSVLLGRRFFLRLDKQAELSSVNYLLAGNTLLFPLAIYFGVMQNRALIQADAKGLAMILLLLSLAAILSIVMYFMNLSLENHRQTIARLEGGMREAYSRAKEKEANDAEIKRLTHDLRHALSLLSAGSEGRQQEIQAMLSHVAQAERVDYSGNAILDALLNGEKQQAERSGVRMEYFLDRVDYSFMDGMDLCAIYGNALENAIEATAKVMDPAQRWVSVKASVLRGIWVLHVDNSYEVEPVRQDDQYLSSKPNSAEHGIGLLSIRYACEKYGGKLLIESGDKVFSLRVMVPVAQFTP